MLRSFVTWISKRIDILLRRICLRRGSRTSAEVSLAPRPGPHSRQNLPWVHEHSTPTSDMQWLSEKLTKAAATWAWTRGLSLSSSTCGSLGATTSWYLVWNVGLKSVAICHCGYRNNSYRPLRQAGNFFVVFVVNGKFDEIK